VSGQERGRAACHSDAPSCKRTQSSLHTASGRVSGARPSGFAPRRKGGSKARRQQTFKNRTLLPFAAVGGVPVGCFSCPCRLHTPPPSVPQEVICEACGGPADLAHSRANPPSLVGPTCAKEGLVLIVRRSEKHQDLPVPTLFVRRRFSLSLRLPVVGVDFVYGKGLCCQTTARPNPRILSCALGRARGDTSASLARPLARLPG
jgi:hypothetical protein